MTNFANEDCIICMERNLAKTTKGDKLEHYNSVRMTCCGVSFCISCKDEMLDIARNKGKHFTCPICRSLPGKSEKEDFDQAMKHAKIGRPWALEFIGVMYFTGEVVPQSYRKSYEFVTLAADQGYAASQYSLGILYRDGQGCKQSFELAFRYFYLAAIQDVPNAQNNVGACYARGEGVKRSLEKAFEWYFKAAKNDQPKGQLNVGDCYYNGEGVEQNYEKAVHFYTLAANQGDKDAQFKLSICYINGQGVKQSFVTAIYLLRQFLKDNEDEKMCVEAKEYLDKFLSYSITSCSGCGHHQPKFTLKCGKCLSVYCCNINCQKKHWKNGQKQECLEA